MKSFQTNKLLMRTLSLGIALGGYQAAHAAEFVGKVLLKGGMQNPVAQVAPRIGVALYPLEGQPVPRRTTREFTIEVNNQRLNPSYVLANPGDTVRFVNRDHDYFRLFSPSSQQSLEIDLEPAQGRNQSRIDLLHEDALHVFCRIHAGTYGRIDVVNTPLIRAVAAGETFEFRDLQPGRWKLRISAPGAETRELEVLAMTAPPVLDVELESLVLARTSHDELHEPVGVEQLFPNQPGY